MELEATVEELENEAVKYINAANALRALSGVAERGRLVFEVVDDTVSQPSQGNARAAATGGTATRASERAPRRNAKAKSGRKSASYAWTPERRAAQAETIRQRRLQQELEGSGSNTAGETEPQTGE